MKTRQIKILSSQNGWNTCEWKVKGRPIRASWSDEQLGYELLHDKCEELGKLSKDVESLLELKYALGVTEGHESGYIEGYSERYEE